MSMVDFQSYAGPGDKALNNNSIEGYQPVSRIGEIVINAFVDAYEFTNLPPTIKSSEMFGDAGVPATAYPDADGAVEVKPMFHEWATVQPGMITLARKKRTAIFGRTLRRRRRCR